MLDLFFYSYDIESINWHTFGLEPSPKSFRYFLLLNVTFVIEGGNLSPI